MKKLLLTLLLVIGGITSSFAQDCSDDRDDTHADRVDYVRFTRGNETFVLLRSEEAHYADLSGVTITHQWSYVLNGADLQVIIPSGRVVYTIENFRSARAFAQDLNTLTKWNFNTYETQNSTVNGAVYTFN